MTVDGRSAIGASGQQGIILELQTIIPVHQSASDYLLDASAKTICTLM